MFCVNFVILTVPNNVCLKVLKDWSIFGLCMYNFDKVKD